MASDLYFPRAVLFVAATPTLKMRNCAHHRVRRSVRVPVWTSGQHAVGPDLSLDSLVRWLRTPGPTPILPKESGRGLDGQLAVLP